MERLDTVVRGALVYDGTGSVPRIGDIGIAGDRIEAVGVVAQHGEEEIEARGLAVAPGFIDVHTHDDHAVLGGASAMACKLSQGVTSVIVGNCGISLAPVAFEGRPPAPLDLLAGPGGYLYDGFAAYAAQLEQSPPAVNVMALIGHMVLRLGAMGADIDRPATSREIQAMRQRLASALEEGASGFSTGLWYPLNRAAPADEVVALGEVLHRFNGIYCSHMRDEADGLLASIDETLDAGRRMPAPIVISHHKCMYPENWGSSGESLARLDLASSRQSVDFDAYPYSAGSTSIFPDVVRPDVPVTVNWSASHPDQAGRLLADIAADWGVGLREAAERLCPGGGTYHNLDETDVQRILSHPRCMIGSDGLPGGVVPHPRLWGTFPRVLGHYARVLGLFTLEEAIRKMTSRPAAVYGLAGRGVIREGGYADLVVFDPHRIKDSATYENPTAPAAGVVGTWVNGVLAYVDAEVTGSCGGRLLTRNRA
jgi:N-acyl-D-amino-acid deacylase